MRKVGRRREAVDGELLWERSRLLAKVGMVVKRAAVASRPRGCGICGMIILGLRLMNFECDNSEKRAHLHLILTSLILKQLRAGEMRKLGFHLQREKKETENSLGMWPCLCTFALGTGYADFMRIDMHRIPVACTRFTTKRDAVAALSPPKRPPCPLPRSCWTSWESSHKEGCMYAEKSPKTDQRCNLAGRAFQSGFHLSVHQPSLILSCSGLVS